MILLVRHAKAGRRGDWAGPDEARPLSAAGRRQADALVPMLLAFGPTRVLSSAYVRCVQTVEPLAVAARLPVETAGELAEGADVDALRKLVHEVDDGVAVLCSHGDMIPALLDDLGVRWRDRSSKGSTWVLSPTMVSDARYLPPPAS